MVYSFSQDFGRARPFVPFYGHTIIMEFCKMFEQPSQRSSTMSRQLSRGCMWNVLVTSIETWDNSLEFVRNAQLICSQHWFIARSGSLIFYMERSFDDSMSNNVMNFLIKRINFLYRINWFLLGMKDENF